MTELPTAERARARYADALYQSALLRDPDPDRAAQAVIAAFRRVDWANVPLDDRTEARLIQCLPPLPRVRLRRPPPIAPLPPPFWKLPPATRLALGLRLLRGLSTELIAEALGQPVDAVRTLLVEGIAASSDPPLELGEACRACLAARLDDPTAERGHLLA